MLFYHRHTEGMPSKSRKLDRTLSESFADEVRNARSSEVSVEKSKEDSIQEDMEEEGDTRENKKKKEDSSEEKDEPQMDDKFMDARSGTFVVYFSYNLLVYVRMRVILQCM